METSDMRTGRCPKCGSHDVRSGTSIPSKDKIMLHTGQGLFAPLHKLDQYVCPNCGYVETYLQDAEGLAYINQHWPRAGTK